jgi:hypothetical protein
VHNYSTETDFELRSQGGSVGLSRKLGVRVTAGGFYSQDDGTVRGGRLSYDASGFSTGLYASLARKADGRFSADAGVSYGSYEFKGGRPSMISQVAGRTDATTYDVWTGANYLLVRGKRVSLSALAGLAYTASYVDGFSEKGGIDAFRIHGMKDKLVLGELGAEAVVALTDRLSFTARGIQSHNFQDRRREVHASFLSGGGRARVVAPSIEEKETEIGASMRFALSNHAAIGGYYDRNLSASAGSGSQFGVRVNIKF